MISFSHSHSSTKGIYGQSINKTTTTKIIHDDLCWHFRFIWIIFEAKKKEKKEYTQRTSVYTNTTIFLHQKKQMIFVVVFIVKWWWWWFGCRCRCCCCCCWQWWYIHKPIDAFHFFHTHYSILLFLFCFGKWQKCVGWKKGGRFFSFALFNVFVSFNFERIFSVFTTIPFR